MDIMGKERIIPFVWMNKETKQELLEMLLHIKDLGIQSLMLESRVHAHFCQTKWFEEVDVVMDFAQKNGMSVYLLDDRSYPSGCANGVFAQLYPEYAARFLIAQRTDVYGPQKNAKFIFELDGDSDERLVGAFLCKRSDRNSYSEIQDVTDNIHGDFLYLDLPDGEWSVIYLIDTTNYAERSYYVDMLSEKSVEKFIETVYEPHYQRYKEHFGKTFKGFFSDEPRFANGRYLSSINYKGKIRSVMGEFGTAYPWSKQVENSFKGKSDILGLWFDIGEKTPAIRCEYMELITDIMSENFSGRIADWCNQRNVSYMGHIIEDNGNHASLGCSLGHYYKSQKRMNMASVDIVLHQIKPYDNDIPHFGSIAGGYGYPAFFNYTLLKLASSCARLDKEKQGRALCEIFGAYGWGESTQDMLYLVNLCIAQGINHFIPHAFSHDFGATDCPPHFYAGGKYGTYTHHKLLFSYMNALSEEFDGGDAEINYAVLYHAQAEWSGNKYEPCDDLIKLLADHGVGVDIIDFSHLQTAVNSADGVQIHGRKYKKLVCPYFQGLPKRYEEILEKLQENVVYAKENNANILKEIFGEDVPTRQTALHRLTYVKNGEKYEFVFNGSGQEVVLKNTKGYRCAVNRLRGYAVELGQELILQRGEAVVLRNDSGGLPIVFEGEKVGEIDEFSVDIKSYDENTFNRYKDCVGVDFDINSFQEKPSFTGLIKYRITTDLTGVDYLEIEYDADGFWVESEKGKTPSIGGKCRYLLSEAEKKSGRVEIVLMNSFAYLFKDRLSKFNFIAPTRLYKVALYKQEK